MGIQGLTLRLKLNPYPARQPLLRRSPLPACRFQIFFSWDFCRTKKAETLFKEIAESKRTVVFYESPHRIMKTLASLSSHLEAKLPSGRRVVVARELTKIYEEVVSGTPAELINYFEKNKEKSAENL